MDDIVVAKWAEYCINCKRLGYFGNVFPPGTIFGGDCYVGSERRSGEGLYLCPLIGEGNIPIFPRTGCCEDFENKYWRSNKLTRESKL